MNEEAFWKASFHQKYEAFIELSNSLETMCKTKNLRNARLPRQYLNILLLFISPALHYSVSPQYVSFLFRHIAEQWLEKSFQSAAEHILVNK